MAKVTGERGILKGWVYAKGAGVEGMGRCYDMGKNRGNEEWE